MGSPVHDAEAGFVSTHFAMEIVAHYDITYRQLSHWVREGLIRPTVYVPGQGNYSLWSRFDTQRLVSVGSFRHSVQRACPSFSLISAASTWGVAHIWTGLADQLHQQNTAVPDEHGELPFIPMRVDMGYYDPISGVSVDMRVPLASLDHPLLQQTWSPVDQSDPTRNRQLISARPLTTHELTLATAAITNAQQETRHHAP